jgi:hypothetical protein
MTTLRNEKAVERLRGQGYRVGLGPYQEAIKIEVTNQNDYSALVPVGGPPFFG